MSKLLSWLNLAYRFNLHMIRKPFIHQDKGKALFLNNYRADNLFPLTEELRRRMPELSRCISCGLCDTTCPNLEAARRHLFNGPSQLASCHTRSLPDYRLLEPSLANWKACGACNLCQEICPTAMPLKELARLVREIMEAQAAAQND